MKLSSFLFEETNEQSNEETIANVILGKEKSTDPEDLEYDVEKQGLEDFEADVVADNDLFEAIEKPTKPAIIRLGQIDKKFFNDLLKKVSNVFVLQKIQRGFFRIQPTENLKDQLVAEEITTEDFVAILANAKNTMFDGLDVKIIGKGEVGGGSDKFDTYQVRGSVKQNETEPSKIVTIKIVICAGGNEGHNFEAQFKNEIKTATGENWLNLLCFLIQKNLITEASEIKDYSFVGKQRVRRSLTVENQFEIQNIGEKISDLTLFLYGNRKIYISLKGEKGQTFANIGVAGIFTPDVIGDKKTKNYKSEVKVNYSADSTFISLMEALGVNINDIKMGFEAYGDGLLGKDPKYSQKIQNILEANGQKAIDYLVAQLGYGYVYFRRTTSGGYRIFNLDTPDAARELVGTFVSGKVFYPYYLDKNKSTKQCTIEISTTTTVYTIQIRSTKGLKKASNGTEESEEAEETEESEISSITVGSVPTANQIAAAKSFLDSLESKVTVKKLTRSKDFVCTDRNIDLKRTVPDAYLGVVENKHIKNSFKLSKYLF
jgi:hypothetical protein